jgi:L-fuculose-phosphate aldolase
MCPGTSGNLGVRCDDGLLITPSGVPYDVLEPNQIVSLGLDGERREQGLRPSSEWQLHTAILRARSDAAAIVHTHSPYATALACTRQGIPAFHYMVAVAGGVDIRCARYATFGTRELADCAVAALAERQACLLANHGVVALGSSIERAESLAFEVENLARQYAIALRFGAPALLSSTEMEDVLERFSDYGQPDANG